MRPVNRDEIFADDEIQVFQLVNRCVRRTYRCGHDDISVRERIVDRQSARDVSTPDAQDARVEHGEQAGSCAAGSASQESPGEIDFTSTVEQRLPVGVTGPVSSVAGLDGS